MQTLLKAHADFECRDADGNTAFLLCAKHKGRNCIHKIMQKVSSSMVVREDGTLVESRLSSKIVDLWAVNNMGQSFLHLMVKHWHAFSAESFCDDLMSISDYQRLDLYGHSPFHYALIRTDEEGPKWCEHILDRHHDKLSCYKV